MPDDTGADVLSTGFASTSDGRFFMASALTPPADAGPSIQYVFPVEIEVRAAPEPLDPDAIASATLAQLAAGLRGLSPFGGA